MLNVAIIDDYAGVALSLADWACLSGLAQVSVFREPLDRASASETLQPFDVICTMRERTALNAAFFAGLPHLRLVTIVGPPIDNLDEEAATRAGVILVHPSVALKDQVRSRVVNAAPELAWSLMIATVRKIAHEDRRLRQGGWQNTVGPILAGRTIGLLGLGRTGKRMAEYARVFGMETIAWSQNLDAETASEVGVRRVDKDELFAGSDVLSIHVRLSERTRGLVGARELALMPPTAYLINTSRGPIIDEQALISCLTEGRIAGAGLDVFDQEPLQRDHPFLALDNVTLTPHLGYATSDSLSRFYADMPEAIAAYVRGAPVRVLNPAALSHAKHVPAIRR